jgi:hypothetical protein
MTQQRNCTRQGLALDDRGIALPLALVGLLVVTAMVMGLIFSSTTEVAISGAHRTGVSSLYEAEGAVGSYLASVASATQAPEGRIAPASELAWANNGKSFSLSIAQLGQREEEPADNRVRRHESFSIVAAPADGRGRSVGTVVETLLEFIEFDMNVDAGAVTGGGLVVTGNSMISAFSSACADSSGFAIRYTTDVNEDDIDYDDRNVEGEVAQYEGVSSDELFSHLLEGLELSDLKEHATIKFGYDGFSDWSNTRVNTGHGADSRHNWGCPVMEDLGYDCDSEFNGRMPLIVIDATNLSNNRVAIQGDYGQGVLVVMNGDIRVTGNFSFKGVVLVDGVMEVSGTGSAESKIEGALVAKGGVRDSRISGNAFVRHNICAIDEVQQALKDQNRDTAPHQFYSGRDRNRWFEVVR